MVQSITTITTTKMYLIYTMLPPEISSLPPQITWTCYTRNMLLTVFTLLTPHYSDLLVIVTSLGKSSHPHQVKYLVIFLKKNKNTSAYVMLYLLMDHSQRSLSLGSYIQAPDSATPVRANNEAEILFTHSQFYPTSNSPPLPWLTETDGQTFLSQAKKRKLLFLRNIKSIF